MRHRSKVQALRSTCVALLTAVAACGGTTDPAPVEDDPAIEPFVGTWDAGVLTVTSDADTTIVADLIEIDGAFTLNVQPSGQYTAQLAFPPADSLGIEPFIEIGQMTVTDGFLTLRPTTPPGPAVSSEYTFVSDDVLRVVGPTDFDFNLDGDPDPAELYIEMERR